MDRFKQIVHKLLFPKLAVVLISVPAAAALLTYTFVFEKENSPIAYPSYVLSAYALIIVCARVAKYARMSKNGLKEAIDSIPIAHRYFTDVTFKMHVSLYLSLGLNLLYAVMKLIYGVCYRSVWFGTLAVYYIMLALMRFLLLHHVNKVGFGTEILSELKQYRLCGVILMLMNITLAGVVILVVSKNEGFEYAGYLIYVMAMYAFYSIITAKPEAWTDRSMPSCIRQNLSEEEEKMIVIAAAAVVMSVMLAITKKAA